MPQHRSFIAVVVVTLLLCATVAQERLTEQERRGRSIYRRGESVSGRPVTAMLGDDSFALPATTLPCANCHGADGKGKPEGGVIPTELTWDSLTKPYGHTHPTGRTHPAFDALSLERALVEGVDPAGRKLSPAMPKYQMAAADMTDLLAYLRRLDDDRDPGITESSLTIGTLLPTSGALAETGQAIREVLTAYFAELNQQGGLYHRRIELKFTTPEQLANESLFALVGAMTAGAEPEIAALVSREEMPLIGPFTVAPTITNPPDRHTFYLFAGLHEQARALAQFAAQTPPTKAALIVLEDARTNDLASAMESQCQQLGWKNVQRIAYTRGRLQPSTLVHRLEQEGVEAIFFLGASGDEKALLDEATKLSYLPSFYLPGSLASRELLTSMQNYRQTIYLAYPTVPTDQTPAAFAEFRALLVRHDIAPRHTAAQLSAYVAAKLFTEGVKRAGRDLTREKLITALEGLYEFDTGLTPRLTFGPNRRIGAFGAHIVTFDRTKKTFVPAGNWISLAP